MHKRTYSVCLVLSSGFSFASAFLVTDSMYFGGGLSRAWTEGRCWNERTIILRPDDPQNAHLGEECEEAQEHRDSGPHRRTSTGDDSCAQVSHGVPCALVSLVEALVARLAVTVRKVNHIVNRITDDNHTSHSLSGSKVPVHGAFAKAE